jgi:hypothetical protein
LYSGSRFLAKKAQLQRQSKVITGKTVVAFGFLAPFFSQLTQIHTPLKILFTFASQILRHVCVMYVSTGTFISRPAKMPG